MGAAAGSQAMSQASVSRRHSERGIAYIFGVAAAAAGLRGRDRNFSHAVQSVQVVRACRCNGTAHHDKGDPARTLCKHVRFGVPSQPSVDLVVRPSAPGEREEGNRARKGERGRTERGRATYVCALLRANTCYYCLGHWHGTVEGQQIAVQPSILPTTRHSVPSALLVRRKPLTSYGGRIRHFAELQTWSPGPSRPASRVSVKAG
ncbi:hypothetical protein Purlil1_6944 [Purpureocillium lilacinum]|uniref:Uncharacterized protein n=1 Tax=Purpureocillium lilacinum TaxID=33203 RepID=A0ABR0BYI2_PURLI|nr:hypothetical protein Purlil1_6944 [Purpureocillium lilacinum]